ncbi:SAM domain-containing protein, partial [Aureobasidium melanogenum]
MSSSSHSIGNRNSTPDASSSTLRPPSSRGMNPGHHLRASADMGAFSTSSPLASRGIRPASEVYFSGVGLGSQDDAAEKAAQQWIADIDQYETTLEDMAAATLDQDFKDELSAIEQWFRVLSEPERTAALYALLQQTTQVQIRFFIQVLQQMAKSHPMSGVLSPANFGEKDPMSTRLNDAMSRLNMEGTRSSFGFGAKPPPSPGAKRNSGLDPSTINSLFPDAAAAIAKQKADFKEHTGSTPTSSRVGDRSSLLFDDKKDAPVPLSPSPWNNSRNENQPPITRPRSSQGQQPMGQFSQPLRSPRPFQLSGDTNLQNTTVSAPNQDPAMNILSPYNPNNSWASMVNTPMLPNFNTQQQSAAHADMVANATAMKLAALSTVNNRIQLDDVKKFRRARSNEGQPQYPQQQQQNMNILMTNELGQVLTPQQAAALQAQQLAALQQGGRSRPSSPGIAISGPPGSNMNHLPMTQNNGFLSTYDAGLLNANMGALNMGNFGMGGHEGYLSDHSEARGRSPRGRRGSSKPPEDPTDLQLLSDIPSWLRSLRLHKYTDQLKDMRWQDLVQLDDDALDKKGVNALGARRKLLKVFETVREAQAEGKL